jgi:CSLREA domain-containing protein
MHRFAAVFLFVVTIAPNVVHATELVVTKTTDTLDGACDDDDCSLREAVVASNSGPAM